MSTKNTGRKHMPIKAYWGRAFPTPYEIDDRDEEAARRHIKAVVPPVAWRMRVRNPDGSFGEKGEFGPWSYGDGWPPPNSPDSEASVAAGNTEVEALGVVPSAVTRC